MGFRFDPSASLKKMAGIKQRSMFAAEQVAKIAADRMEGEEKRNAPWTDRPGNARQTIRGVSGWAGKKLRCGVTGNMEYSPHLELTHAGQNAVIWPTVQANKQKIMDAYRKVVR